MLTLYRRHLADCPHEAEGRNYTKCSCPIYRDGFIKSKRIRQSLDTSSWDRARRRLADIESEAAGERVRKPFPDALDTFLIAREVEGSTLRKYKRILTRLKEFAARHEIATVDRLGLEHLDAYRQTRRVNALSWSKELQLLRTFFSFCVKRKWCEENPAKDMDMPPDPKPKPREPYTSEEIIRILAACDTFGKYRYERLRAKAMILLLRRYGLRVSDVAMLERDRVRNGRIFLHAMKNGAALWLPLWDDVQAALSVVPPTMGAPADCRYFFWTGLGARDGHIETVDRTLQAVFRKSGVEHANAHRFRHTLATEILVSGGTIEDAANVLGDSPAVVRKHYAKWSTAYQTRTLELLERIHGKATGTKLVHEKILPGSASESEFRMVLEEGVEPS